LRGRRWVFEIFLSVMGDECANGCACRLWTRLNVQACMMTTTFPDKGGYGRWSRAQAVCHECRLCVLRMTIPRQNIQGEHILRARQAQHGILCALVDGIAKRTWPACISIRLVRYVPSLVQSIHFIFEILYIIVSSLDLSHLQASSNTGQWGVGSFSISAQLRPWMMSKIAFNKRCYICC